MRPEEVTCVILHVGDIANCYDELNHANCLDGVAWARALSKMPEWYCTQNTEFTLDSGRVKQTS